MGLPQNHAAHTPEVAPSSTPPLAARSPSLGLTRHFQPLPAVDHAKSRHVLELIPPASCAPPPTFLTEKVSMSNPNLRWTDDNGDTLGLG